MNRLLHLIAAGAVMAPAAAPALTQSQAAVLGYAAGQVVCTLERIRASDALMEDEVERLGVDAYRLIGRDLTQDEVQLVMHVAQRTLNHCPFIRMPDA